MNSSLGHTVGLATRVDAEPVGFVFAGANVRVQNGSEHEEKGGDNQQGKRQDSGIANIGYSPAFPITRESPVEPPSKDREENHDDHRKEENVFRNVVKNVVAHLVAHHCFNFFGRTTAKKIVV